MHYSPVVDTVPTPTPLDPLSLIAFVALFVAGVVLTRRRPSYGVAALLFSVPFAGYRDVLGTAITAPKIVLLATIIGLLGHRDALRIVRERSCAMLIASLGIVVVATGLTFLGASHHAPVVRETLEWIEYLALVVAAYTGYRLDRYDALYVHAVALSTGIVCLSALAQETVGAPSGLWFNNQIIPRIAGALEGPNQLAGYLEVQIALLAVWNIARPQRAIGCVLAAAGATSLLTFSRGGLIGCALAVCVIAVASRPQMNRLRGLAPLVGGWVVGGGVAAFWAFAVHSFAVFRATLVTSSYAGGVGNRADLWRVAWYFFRTHPLLGIGAGNYELELANAGLVGIRTHANSWYLQSLAEGGIVLFAAILTFLTTTFTMLARIARSSPWALGALAATTALTAHQIVDLLVFYPKVGAPWMLAIALGVAASVPSKPCAD